VNTVIKFRVPQNLGKFLSSRTTGGFSRRAQPHAVGDVKLCLNIRNITKQCGGMEV
jgi:hypothetical protein